MTTAIFALILASSDASAAVFEMRSAHGISDALVTLLNEELVTHLAKAGTFTTVIGGSDLSALLDLEQQKSALGCEDSNCLAALGGVLGVPYLVVPAIGKLGSTYLINLKLVDVEAARPLWRDRREVSSEDELNTALKELSAALHLFRHPDSSKNRTLPTSMAWVGGLTSGAATAYFFWSKQSYTGNPTRSHYERASQAQSIGLPLAAGAAVIGIAGVIWRVLQ